MNSEFVNNVLILDYLTPRILDKPNKFQSYVQAYKYVILHYGFSAKKALAIFSGA